MAAVCLAFGTAAGFPDHLVRGSHNTEVFVIEPTADELCDFGFELLDSYGNPWPTDFRSEVVVSIHNQPEVAFINHCQQIMLISGPLGIDSLLVFPNDVQVARPEGPGLAVIGGVTSSEPRFVQFVTFPID